MQIEDITSGFGYFARLPAELRLMIWKCCLTEKQTKGDVRLRRHMFNIVLVNREITTELTCLLYDRRTFTFHVAGRSLDLFAVDLARDRDDRVDHRVGRVNMQELQFKGKDFLHELSPVRLLNVSHYTFTRLDAVHVELPVLSGRRERMQMQGHGRSVAWLVDYLSKVENMPVVRVIPMTDVKSFAWERYCGQQNLGGQQSERQRRTYQSTSPLGKLYRLLMPFFRLKARGVEVELFDKYRFLRSDLRTGRKKFTVEYADDLWTLNLEAGLDVAYLKPPFPAEDSLRMQAVRFICWTKQYERQQVSCIQIAWQAGRIDNARRKQAFRALADRYLAMRAYNLAWVAHIRSGQYRPANPVNVGDYQYLALLPNETISPSKKKSSGSLALCETYKSQFQCYGRIADPHKICTKSGLEVVLHLRHLSSMVVRRTLKQFGESDNPIVIVSFDGLSIEGERVKRRPCLLWICPKDDPQHNARSLAAWLPPEPQTKVLEPLCVEVQGQNVRIIQQGKLGDLPEVEGLTFSD